MIKKIFNKINIFRKNLKDLAKSIKKKTIYIRYRRRKKWKL